MENKKPIFVEMLDTIEALYKENAELKETYKMMEGKFIKRLKKLEAVARAAKTVIDEQANDAALWSCPREGTQPITEAYLQQQLRRIHTVIENCLDALEEKMSAEETLYTGFCPHGIPFGHCKEKHGCLEADQRRLATLDQFQQHSDPVKAQREFLNGPDK